MSEKLAVRGEEQRGPYLLIPPKANTHINHTMEKAKGVNGGCHTNYFSPSPSHPRSLTSDLLP